jgi:hypothetical protein
MVNAIYKRMSARLAKELNENQYASSAGLAKPLNACRLVIAAVGVVCAR